MSARTASGGESSAWPLNVSLVALIANPERFDGQLVRVSGFVRLEFEGTSLFLSEEDDRFNHTKNGVWLKLPESFYTDCDGKHCDVVGHFSARNMGHAGLFSGGIVDRSGENGRGYLRSPSIGA
jgi:hypothetical protein